MSRNKLFIDLYNHLDQSLRTKYHINNLGESVISKYIACLHNSYNHDDQIRADELETIRVLRNNLVHSLQIDNDDLFVIQDKVLDILEYEIAIIEHPILVSQKMIQLADVYIANLNSVAKNLIKIMLDRGFSYIPIINPDHTLYGVFSALSILTAAFNNEQFVMDDNVLVRSFDKYLDLNAQKGKYFMFVREESTMDEVLYEYQNNVQKGKKLALMFVTRNGFSNEPILGILTPYDLLYRE